MEESVGSPILGTHKKKKGKAKQNQNLTYDYVEVLSIQQEQHVNKDEPTKCKVDFKTLLVKLKEICLSKRNVDDKFKLVLNLIFEECFQFMWNLFKEKDIMSSLISTIYGLFV